MYVHAVESGETLVLDDHPYQDEIYGGIRYFDLRAVRIGDNLSYTWRDVSERHLAQEALAIGKTRETQLQQVLSLEQWRTYQASKPERTAEGMTRLMTMQLGLSDEQVPHVEQINLTATRRMKAEMGDHFQEKSRRQKQKIYRALRAVGEERDQSLVKVLTGEQWGTYVKNKEEMREVMKERLQERNP
jgi:uncharacterized protein YqjF (DUF2071 family)